MNPQPFLTRAGRWLLNSGIQEPFGGVARYYRADLRKNSPVSTEITGYAASAMLYLHARTSDPRYLDAALRAGRFLTGAAWDAAAQTFPFEFAVNGDLPERRAYFFDAGIILRALLALWRATRDPRYLETALAAAQSMAKDFDAGPEFHPILVLPGKEPLAREPRWSREPGCYQLKAGLAWYELFELTGIAEFRAHYEKLLAYALGNEASFLPGETSQERVMDRLHAYCYFLEGLLPCAARPDCARALCAGIDRVGRLLREIAPVFERSDVYAQLLRLRLFAGRLGAAPLDRAAAEEEACGIPGFQFDDTDPRTRGGFCFGRKGVALLPYVNPVSTAFCAQALQMWREHRAGQFQPDWRDLI